MRAFTYSRPQSLEEVVRLIGEEEGAALLAGGTDHDGRLHALDARLGRRAPATGAALEA